jgi:hypothetical protein
VNIMIQKQWLYLALALPLLALLGWALYEQAQVWSAPRPRWVEDVNGLKYSGPCDRPGKAAIEAYQILRADEGLAAGISGQQAAELASRVIARHFGIHTEWLWGSSPPDPELSQVTFPDGQRRLAWPVFTFFRFGEDVMEGEVTGVFIDANTGEALMLVTGQSVGDPCMTCGCLFEGMLINRLSKNQFEALFYAICYLVVVGIAAALVRGGRFVVSRKSGGSSPPTDPPNSG